MITKQEWIKFQTTGINEKANRQVIEFIAGVQFHSLDIVRDPLLNYEAINNLFTGGYCYYFAVMLKEAFNRGTICHPIERSHIVWVDNDGMVYDIEGLVEGYSTPELRSDLIPIDEYDDDFINSYKHIPNISNNEEEK